jgi:hypothetical protein
MPRALLCFDWISFLLLCLDLFPIFLPFSLLLFFSHPTSFLTEIQSLHHLYCFLYCLPHHPLHSLLLCPLTYPFTVPFTDPVIAPIIAPSFREDNFQRAMATLQGPAEADEKKKKGGKSGGGGTEANSDLFKIVRYLSTENFYFFNL